MNRGTLPIVARLEAMQTPARLAPGGARVIADLSHTNPLAALLREVNETVLGRALMFESSTGSNLTLDVAGRRVLRLTAVTGLSGADACLSAETLEDHHKDDLIKLLQTVAAPRHELRVMSGPATRDVAGVSVGLPVALLADLCLIELNEVASLPGSEPDLPEPDIDPAPEAGAMVFEGPSGAGFLSRLAQGMGPSLMAWLIVGGVEDGQTYGPEEMTSHLYGFLQDEADAVSRQLDLVTMVPAGPVCIVLGATLTDGHCILCARSGDGLLLGVVEGDSTQTLLQAWNAANG